MCPIHLSNTHLLNQLSQHAIDFHCHGVGRFDFTEILELDLAEIESILASRKQRTVLTLYLPKPKFKDFLALMEQFYQGKQAGHFQHIVGFGLEGPLLASHGGTPEEGVWMPTQWHWQQLANCGPKGLLYVILSPDAVFDDQISSNHLASPAPSVTWIAETLLTQGVLPAPGHFTKVNPQASAKALQSLFNVVIEWGQGATITDHLFNDMPHNFKHAWRTPAERIHREQEIQSLQLDTWSLSTLHEKLGPVPAIMIENARRGYVKICQNFDGEHVDLSIVKKAVELIGAENMLMMTDSIESRRLAGRTLHRKPGSTLLYQDEGIVAAGSQPVTVQITHMLSMGLTETQIQQITQLNPLRILQQHRAHEQAQADCI